MNKPMTDNNPVKLPIHPAQYELLCQRCSTEHPVWSVTNDLWNATVLDGEHFFCPTCFIILADERGIVKKGIWRMRLSNLEKADEHESLSLKLAAARSVVELAYKLARHIRNTDELPMSQRGVKGCDLLAELQTLAPAAYDVKVKSVAAIGEED